MPLQADGAEAKLQGIPMGARLLVSLVQAVEAAAAAGAAGGPAAATGKGGSAAAAAAAAGGAAAQRLHLVLHCNEAQEGQVLSDLQACNYCGWVVGVFRQTGYTAAIRQCGKANRARLVCAENL